MMQTLREEAYKAQVQDLFDNTDYSKFSADVEDTESTLNFDFLTEPHKELYPCAFRGTDKIPTAVAKILKDHVLQSIETEYKDPDEWIIFTVYGSGISYNWSEAGDFDIQMWVDYSKFQDNDTPVTADDLLADVRRLTQLVNFPSFAELGLTWKDCKGAQLIQFYPKIGEGTDEENLASKPYSCYNLDEDRWILKPTPITPQFYGEGFLLVMPKCQDIALQSEAALDELNRNVIDYQFWTGLNNEHPQKEFEQEIEDAKAKAIQSKEGITNLFLGVFQGRAQAYSPDGKGANDERDLTQKLLEVWGIFQKLKHFARAPLPWEDGYVPDSDLPAIPLDKPEADDSGGQSEKSSKWITGSPKNVVVNNLMNHFKPFSSSWSIIADWNDVQEKAQRYYQDGMVQMHLHTPNHAVATVSSETTPGQTYQTELWKDDPNSNAITLWSCFMYNTPVSIPDGSRKIISEILPGDSVVTHTGKTQKVINTMNRPFEGKIARVKLSGIQEEIVATEDHRFWASDENIHLQRVAPASRWRVTGATTLVEPKIGWKELGSLEKGDYLSYSPPIEERKLNRSYNGNVQNRYDTQTINIAIDEDLAYLLGWYVAEGFIVKGSTNRIGFSLNISELNEANILSKICEDKFGTAGTIRLQPKGNTIDFRVSHFGLRQLVEELFGTGASDKRLHRDMITLDKNLQESFIKGWFEGDGHTEKTNGGKEKRNVISTVSYDLANQIRTILARLGYTSDYSWNDENFGNGFVKNCKRIYRIRWNPNKDYNSAQRLMDNGVAWYRVESITLEDFKGSVYDIEVEEDHSFQVYSINCHNCTCPWGEVSWGRTRRWKKFEGRPCVHATALQWTSQKTPPQDDQENEQMVIPGMEPPTPGTTPIPDVSPSTTRQPGVNLQPFAEPVGPPTPGGPNVGIIPPPTPPPPPTPQPMPQPQAPPPQPQRPPSRLLQPGEQTQLEFPGTFTHIKTAWFNNGDAVKPKEPVWGQDRDGNDFIVPKGMTGTVIWSDPEETIVTFDIEINGPLEPMTLRVQDSTDMFMAAPRSNPGFRRR